MASSKTLVPITGFWAFPFSAYFIVLSGRVVWERKQLWLPMGDRSPTSNTPELLAHDPLYTAIRCHQNYLENAPLGLVLATLVELNGANSTRLNWALGGFLLLRVLHVEAGLRWPGTRGLGRHLGYWGSLAYLFGMGVWGAKLARGLH